jgi:tail lysozyme
VRIFLTAGTRSTGSRLSPVERAAARPGGPRHQSQDGWEAAGFGSQEEAAGLGSYADDVYDASGDSASYGYPAAYGNLRGTSPDGFAALHGEEEPAATAPVAVIAAPGAAGQEAAGREPDPRRDGGRYTGRHSSPRGKTTRKRVGKVVPAVAAAAALAAGTAAYAVAGGGQPQAAQLKTSMILPAGTGTAAAGSASAAASSAAKDALADAAGAAAPARAAVSAKPKATPAATAAAATRGAASGKTPASAPAASTTPAAPARAAAPAASSPASHAAVTAAPATRQAATTLSCNLSSGLLPQNVTAIVSFLLAHGYSDNAAAGIAGNIYQESKGNPESEGMGGGGLIGWTPLPSGFVTGNVSADLQTQLAALLTYNQGWSSYLPALNSAASPSDAAYIYVTDFERAGIPAASTREASAADVAQACGI